MGAPSACRPYLEITSPSLSTTVAASTSAIRGSNAVVATCAAAGVAMLCVWALSWLTSPSYSTVVTGLSGTQLADAGAALDRAGIEHRLDSQSASAHVPVALVDEARTVLAEAGLTPDAPANASVTSPSASRATRPVRRLEQAVAADVERLLLIEGGLVATAVVRATFDADAEVTTREQYNPDEVVPLAERQTHVKAELTTPEGEVLSRYRRAAAQRVNGATRTVTSTRKGSAALTRLSVAVVVQDTGDGDFRLKVSRREVKRLVSAAAGLDKRRGDTVAVSFAPR